MHRDGGQIDRPYKELKGFENLGEVNGSILLLKEKEEKENSQRMI